MNFFQTLSNSLLSRPLLLFITLSALLPTTVTAQTYTAGYTKYQRGDFKGAERSLLQAVTKETSKSATANSWKLLGICQYMLGNKGGATTSFKEALAINTGLIIASGEVLDESVIAHFNKIKSDIIEANKPPPPPAPPPAPPPPPKPLVKKPVKKPVVAVAIPAIDIAEEDAAAEAVTPTTEGAASSKKGGTFIVVQSDTPDANVMIDGILAGQVGSEIEVEPGMLVVEVAVPGEDAKIQKITAVKGQVNTITVNLIKPPQIKKIAKKKPKKIKKVSRKKKKNDEMFADKPGAPQRAGYNSATEFDSDTASGVSPYAPAPPPAPYYGQPYQQPQVAMNNQPYDDRYENRAALHGNYFIAALPFGAGQFQNRTVGTGMLFFAGEAGALYFYTAKNKEAKSTEADIALYEEEAKLNEGEKTDEEKDADAVYIQETRDYVASTRAKAKLGLYGFGALWVAGAIEAYINDPIAKSASQPQRRDRAPGYGQKNENQNSKLLPPEDRHYKSDWQVQLVPEAGTRDDGSEDRRLKLVWQLKF